MPQEQQIKHYNLESTHKLLVEGFYSKELLRFCYHHPEFRTVYEQLPSFSGADIIVDKIIDYANRRELFDVLLNWAKQENPAKYKRYQPYYVWDTVSEANQDSLDFIETTWRFFKAAGFEINNKQEDNYLTYIGANRQWRNKFMHVPVEMVLNSRLDGEQVRQIYQTICKRLNNTPTEIFIIINRPPTESGLAQIAALAVDNKLLIPIDDTLIFEGQRLAKQKRLLERHINQFIGQRDFYDIKNPVIDRLNFFGREALAKELQQYLEEGHSVALFGIRKMGKSSVLHYLHNQLPFLTALVDLQKGVDLADLYGRILIAWQQSMVIKLPNLQWPLPPWNPTGDPSIAFASASRQLLDYLLRRNEVARLGIFIDEIELIFPKNEENKQRYLAFSRTLRGLHQEDAAFCLLIAGVDPIINRVSRLQEDQNPLYQFFIEKYLPALTPTACKQMIRSIGRRMNLEFEAEAVDFVLESSGGHPYIARQLCSLAFQQQNKPKLLTLKHLQEAATSFIRNPAKSITLDQGGLWGEISNPDLWPAAQVIENQKLLSTLAQYESETEANLLKQAQNQMAYEHALFELKERDILYQPQSQTFAIQLGLFRNWIRRYQLGMEG